MLYIDIILGGSIFYLWLGKLMDMELRYGRLTVENSVCVHFSQLLTDDSFYRLWNTPNCLNLTNIFSAVEPKHFFILLLYLGRQVSATFLSYGKAKNTGLEVEQLTVVLCMIDW